MLKAKSWRKPYETSSQRVGTNFLVTISALQTTYSHLLLPFYSLSNVTIVSSMAVQKQPMGQTWSATPWFTNPFWSKWLTLQVRTQSLKNMSSFCNCQHRSSDLLNPTLGFFYCFPTFIPTLLLRGWGRMVWRICCTWKTSEKGWPRKNRDFSIYTVYPVITVTDSIISKLTNSASNGVPLSNPFFRHKKVSFNIIT